MKTLLLACLLFPTIGLDAQNDESLEPYFTAIIVSDIDQSVNWYTEFLNVKVHDRIELPERGVRIAVMKSNTSLIELLQLSDAKSVDGRVKGFFKVGFKVEDIDQWMRKIESMQIEKHGSLVFDDKLKMRMIIVKDPDGNYIQLFGK